MEAGITFDETGEVVGELLVIDGGPDLLVACVALGRFKARSRQALRAIGKDPGACSRELYNDEHLVSPGAVPGAARGRVLISRPVTVFGPGGAGHVGPMRVQTRRSLGSESRCGARLRPLLPVGRPA
jgi:hypothetical protein